ncbi:hypothetical protein [Mesorhizobium sp. BR-1-1-10]|nr:hypothetical protein [Mesorhizobium sp. BR-1-1-10]
MRAKGVTADWGGAVSNDYAWLAHGVISDLITLGETTEPVLIKVGIASAI